MITISNTCLVVAAPNTDVTVGGRYLGIFSQNYWYVPGCGEPSHLQIIEAVRSSSPPAHTVPHTPSKQISTTPSRMFELFTSLISESLQSKPGVKQVMVRWFQVAVKSLIWRSEYCSCLLCTFMYMWPSQIEILFCCIFWSHYAFKPRICIKGRAHCF